MASPAEDHGFIGERRDADAGLLYLNARYYDPELSLFLQPDWFEVTEPGVGTNRYGYSFNDPTNRIDPNGNGWVKGLLGKLFGTSDAAALRTFQAGMTRLRNEGVQAAWRQEQELVKATGSGTRNWTEDEITELLSVGKVGGYHGHHINNVAAHPEMAGLADNIEFLKSGDHTSLHMDNGGWARPTTGGLIDRRGLYERALGRQMPGRVNERFSYADVLDRTGTVVSKILNSRTMSVLFLLDPTEMVDRLYRQQYGYTYWEMMTMDPMTICAAASDCI